MMVRGFATPDRCPPGLRPGCRALPIKARRKTCGIGYPGQTVSYLTCLMVDIIISSSLMRRGLSALCLSVISILDTV